MLPALLSPQDLQSCTQSLDAKFLAQWMNPMYLQKEKIKQIRKAFIKDSSIQLAEFLHQELASKISLLTVVTDADQKLGLARAPPGYDVGAGGGWRAVGPAHKRRYLAFAPQSSDNTGKSSFNEAGLMLQSVQEGLLRSAAFSRYLKRITTLEPSAFRDEIRRFRPGLDYTVAHYGGMTDIPRLDATLCFVDDQGDYFSDIWESGDAGGFECYIEAEGAEGETPEAAEVYRSSDDKDGDEEGSLLSVSPANNVISLVLRDQGIMRFVKYVGCSAPGSRWDIAVEYEIKTSDTTEEITPALSAE